MVLGLPWRVVGDTSPDLKYTHLLKADKVSVDTPLKLPSSCQTLIKSFRCRWILNLKFELSKRRVHGLWQINCKVA